MTVSKRFLPYSRQDIDEADVEAVAATLRSDFLTQGPAINEFETLISQRCRAVDAIAVSNATAGLHIACLALGVAAGDTVWTSPITFVASANCALYCGAKVDFIDIDPKTKNIDPEALARKLDQAAKQNKLPKVLIPVHFSGLPCDMRDIQGLCRPYGIKIIEDASHAVGASYCGRPVGNCEFSDITIFSFHPVKMITTGEGGMVLTNDSGTAQLLRQLRSHGITREAALLENRDVGEWFYEQHHLGFNYRMCDIQASLGVSQLKRLDHFLAARRSAAEKYNQFLKNLPLRLPVETVDGRSSWHLYTVELLDDAAETKRAALFAFLRERGVGVNVHYIPVHTQPYYRRIGFRAGDFPKAEDYYSRALSLPLHTRLTDEDLSYVAETLTEGIDRVR